MAMPDRPFLIVGFSPMSDFDGLLTKLERLIVEVEAMDDATRGKVFELLDGIDAIHRMALRRLDELLTRESLARLRGDNALAWLLAAYGVGVDEKAAAEAALESIRPYIHSHGGRVEVLDADGGIVRLRMSGTCSGCTASAITLREGIETALRDNFPAFVAIELEADDAPAHPPPGPTLLQIQPPER
jgi:Fe-S cluster biogenesis protein NfuA